MFTCNRRSKVQFLILIIYFVTITALVLNVLKVNSGLAVDGTMPLTNFWNIQLSGADSSLSLEIITMMLFTTFTPSLFIYMKNNQFFGNIHQRIGYEKFLKDSLVKSFMSAFILSFITKVYELTLISVLLNEFPSNIILEDNLIIPPFSDNTLKSWIIFVLLSSIGWGIYAVFIFSIGLFIKKNSLYLIIGAIVGSILIVVPGMLVPILGALSVPFFSTWFLPSLVAPGQMDFIISNGVNNNVYIYYIFSVLIYLTISWGLIQKWLVQKREA